MHLSLKHFILKQEVFNLYRYAIRTSRAIQDPKARRETVAWIRGEFEHNRHMSDVKLIEDKLRQGRREIKQIFPTAR